MFHNLYLKSTGLFLPMKYKKYICLEIHLFGKIKLRKIVQMLP